MSDLYHTLYWTKDIPHDTLEDAKWFVEHAPSLKGEKIRIAKYSDQAWRELKAEQKVGW